MSVFTALFLFDFEEGFYDAVNKLGKSDNNDFHNKLTPFEFIGAYIRSATHATKGNKHEQRAFNYNQADRRQEHTGKNADAKRRCHNTP